MRADQQSSRVVGDRFEIVAQLGYGAMGDVYRARDRARGQDIALKVLPELDATALLRFKNEFRALHDVQHPNIVRLHELHEDHGTWFFTMQLVDGVDLLTWVGRDEARLRRVLPQVAQALQRLHRDGLVHRDVKPPNVLVTASGSATLLDFGLVAPTWSPGSGAGTPAYMAPEQISGDISPATDWYALGVILFRVLTGQLPFLGSPDEVMHAKTERAAPPVRTLAPLAPADLATLTDALLSRVPQERPSGDDVLAALGANAEPTRFSGNVLVGRDAELARLRDAVAARIAGEPFAVSIVGESGIGKTTLLRAFADDTEQCGTWVLCGRCWERESVPYKGFDGVIDELVARLGSDTWAPDDRGWSAILAQAFPVLRQLPAFAQLAPYGEVGGHETAARVSSGVRWLLGEVAARQPLVLVIDDLQWAGRDTLAVLRALIEPPLPNVLVCFGAREPVTLDSTATVQTIALEPLSHADTTTLVDMVVGELGGDLNPSTIAREAAGHPLFAAELARHAVTTGQLGPIKFDDALLARLERAGRNAQDLAAVVGLAYAPIALEAATRATGISSATFFDAIATLRAARLIDTSGVGPATRLEPAHDRIRHLLVARLAPDVRTELHGRIADALEETHADDAAALALHCEDAGQRPRAARHALRAAEQAEAALAFHRAAHLYTWVVDLDPTIPNARVRQAEALAQAGRGVDAANAFLQCAREAEGAPAIDLRRRAMQQLLLMGHSERALELLDALMRWLDLPNPTKPRRIILALLERRAAIRLRRAVLPPMSAGEASAMERARLDVLWDAAAGLAMLDPLRAFYFHSLNLHLCFRSGDRNRIARALLGEGPYLAASGKRTRRLGVILDLADKAAARASYPALTPLSRGTAAFFFGRWKECRAQLAECERMLQQDRPRLVKEGFGPAHLQDLTRRLHLAAVYYLGDLRTLGRRVPELLFDAIERNDLTSATHLRTGVQAWMHLAFGDVDLARRNAELGFAPWRNSRVGIPHVMDTQARVAIDIYSGDGEAAHRRMLAIWPGFVESRVFRAQYVHISMLDLRGRAALAAARDASAARRSGLLADASRCAHQLEASGAVWSPALAELLRAGIACITESKAARTHLERAANGFAATDMALHAATARLAAATLTGNLEQIANARRTFADAGVQDIDRYSRLLLPR